MRLTTTERLYNLADLIFSFFTLSFCWVIGTLLGGIIFGWAPSTTAVLSVLRDQIMEREKFAFSAFKKAYMLNFKQANKIGLMIMVFALIIFINHRNFTTQEETVFAILSGLTTFTGLILIGVTLYVFPLNVHYDVTLKKAFSQSFSFLILRPLYTIILGLWTWVVFSIAFMIPGLALFFGIAVFCYGWMAICYQMFRRNEEYLEREEKATHKN